MTTRRGSFLIVCLCLMVLMVVLAFTVLHDVRLQIETSTGNQRYLLAEAAARSGMDHAVEQILSDYQQTTTTVRSHGAQATVTLPARTFLDGPYRAPFTAIYTPNSDNPGSDTNSATSDNDVRAEDYVLRPWAWWWFENRGWWDSGMLMYDGKGRIYEPGYYNVTTTPAGTAGYPVAPTLFLDANAPVPERAQGIFYDDEFRRIKPSGNLQQDRQAARYRLRYSVGVEDLSGHLLINPVPDMQMLTQPGPNPPPVDYRNPALRNPWMTAATNALGAIAGGESTGMFGAQLEHVFQGRGYQTNVDFDHSPQGLSGWPKTFPLMYRNHPGLDSDNDPYLKNNDGTYQLDANGNKIWDDGDYMMGATTMSGYGNWGSWIDYRRNFSLSTNLFWFVSGTPKGLAVGGEVIPNWHWQDGTNYWPYDSGCINHCLVGPQLSFDNTTYAAHGERAYLGTQDGGGDTNLDKFGITPFGRRLTSTGYNPASQTNKWYQGRVDTPFHLNVMTAPPGIISAVLLAYLPPKEKVFQYTSITWVRFTGLDQFGNRTFQQVQVMPINGADSRNQGSAYGRDLLVDTTAPPAFAPWPAQDRSDANPPGANNPPGATGQYIKPDYYAIDVRDPLKTYPSPFMNGNSTTAGQGSDDLGLNMDEITLGNGIDLHDGRPFVNLYAGWPQHSLQDFDTNPSNLPNAINGINAWASVAAPAGWGTDGLDYAVKSPDPHQVLHTYSYYFDLMGAMAAALTVTRANYVQYDLTWCAAQNIFGAGCATPLECQTLRDLDKLFLAEMGESIDAPGTGTPQTLVAQGAIKPHFIHYGGAQPVVTSDYIPKNNILSLVQQDLLQTAGGVTSAQRGHVMELMLNDFRMSLLGSSPGYSDTADPLLEFRPLDFDGDGVVHCSCYADLDIDHLPYAAVGTKPPAYFTITGNLFIGKSHFYRVFSRGEVWDNLMNIKLDDATLDSVLAVDPEGDNPTQTQFLYQRWFYNRYVAMLPHIER